MSLSDLPKASGREHVKVFKKLGWTERRAKHGHIILTKPGVRAILSIPDHREVTLPLLKTELRKAGIPESDYCDAFNRR